MRRADRLFDIIQLLRRNKLSRAQDLAQELEVSERTIYRDIQDLMASGVPIEGEAGIGYTLRRGFDLPPLMFNKQELEALVLGARIVETWSDSGLASAARDVLAKVEAVIPERLRHYMEETALLAPGDHHSEPIGFELAELREAIRDHHKLSFDYSDRSDNQSNRIVRPLALAFYGPIWVLVAWCELRKDFRSFRLDRISSLSVLKQTFFPEQGKSIRDYLKDQSPWWQDEQ
ncbi:MAG: helix-turn-helix transcriptional regulator [bacterium]